MDASRYGLVKVGTMLRRLGGGNKSFAEGTICRCRFVKGDIVLVDCNTGHWDLKFFEIMDDAPIEQRYANV